MFSCEMCENEMQAYDVTLLDFTKFEVCGDCLEALEKNNQVLMSSRFVGLHAVECDSVCRCGKA